MANKPFFRRRQVAKPMFGKIFEKFAGANLSIVVGKYNKSKHFYICRVASTGSVVTIRASDLPSPIRSNLKEGTVISIPKGTALSLQLASQLGFTNELKVTQDNLEKLVERFSRSAAIHPKVRRGRLGKKTSALTITILNDPDDTDDPGPLIQGERR